MLIYGVAVEPRRRHVYNYIWIWGDELLLMIHVPEWNAEASCLLAKLNFEQTPTMDVVVH